MIKAEQKKRNTPLGHESVPLQRTDPDLFVDKMYLKDESSMLVLNLVEKVG